MVQKSEARNQKPEITPCPLCDGRKFKTIATASDYEYFLPGEFFVGQCLKCGLLSQNPRPAWPEILKHYTEKYEPFRKVGSGLMQELRYLTLIKPQIKKLKKLVPEKARVLDVGCSTGVLLLELKKYTDWELFGIEPIKKAALIAKKAGLDVRITTLEKTRYKPNSFDLIIANHVLEHVPNPAEISKIIFRLLKKDGYFIGKLPCADCLERKIFGPYWQGYHLPRHLTWFSPKNLKKFLAKNGFRKVVCRQEAQVSNWQVSLRNFCYAQFSWKLKIFSGHNLLLYFLSLPFCLLLLFLGSGPIQNFEARK